MHVVRHLLPLRAPLATARGIVAVRTVWTVRLIDAGRVGLGEAAPLPGFGGESPEACAEALAALAAAAWDWRAWLAHGDPLAPLPSAVEAALAATPCARHAVEGALIDLLAQERGVPVAVLLGGPAQARVPVNALADDAATAVAAAAAGFSTVKIKVGGDPALAAQRVAGIRAALPAGVRLRADANGAWTAAQALGFGERLAPGMLEYLEQPVPPAEQLAVGSALRRRGWRVGVDEGVRDAADLGAVIAAGAADVVVLKPQFLGGWQPTRRLIAQARAAGLDVVLTTALEGAIGRAYAVHQVAAAGAGAYAHGLATGDRLAGDLTTRPLEPRAGAIDVPESAGLGIGEFRG